MAPLKPEMHKMEPPAALFPPWGERLAFELALIEDLIQAQQSISDGTVMPSLDLNAIRAEISQFDFSSPQPLAKVIERVNTLLRHGIVQITHQKYFGLFNPNPTFPALCADLITAAFNPQLASAKTSPAAVEIESHVIQAFAQRAGLPQGSMGHFTSGGSEANMTAVICALTNAHSGYAREGVRVFGGQPVFYVSKESHLAWIKIALETGLGHGAVRLIETDGSGRMDMEALRHAIETDRAEGHVPFMLIATAGTTGAGMIDPLEDCYEIARAHGLWYHVDAAWGGAVLVSPRLRHLMGGIERADSITIDAHKWLATTMACGMIFTSHPTILRRAFDVANSFMPSYTIADPYVTSVQWSRRFMGLRLFLSLAAAGWDGYAAHIERSVALAFHVKELLNERGWRVVNGSQLAVLCIAPPGEASPEEIVAQILKEGRVWVSVATFEGRKVIRACISNGMTDARDVEELVHVLENASKHVA